MEKIANCGSCIHKNFMYIRIMYMQILMSKPVNLPICCIFMSTNSVNKAGFDNKLEDALFLTIKSAGGL